MAKSIVLPRSCLQSTPESHPENTTNTAILQKHNCPKDDESCLGSGRKLARIQPIMADLGIRESTIQTRSCPTSKNGRCWPASAQNRPKLETAATVWSDSGPHRRASAKFSHLGQNMHKMWQPCQFWSKAEFGTHLRSETNLGSTVRQVELSLPYPYATIMILTRIAHQSLYAWLADAHTDKHVFLT